MADIANGLGVTGYGDQQKPVDGSPALGIHAKPKANPLAPQEGTLLFGGTETDGDYTASWTLPDGDTLSVTVTRAAGTPATNADLAAAAVAAIAADDAWANVATAEVDGGTPEQVNITWLHAGLTYAEAGTAAPAPGTLAQAITANAGGAAIPVGRFLIARANPQDADIPAAQLPLVGSVAADVIGVNLRDGSVENTGLPGPDQVESTLAGRMMSVAWRGPVYMTNVGSVDAISEAACFAVNNPAGGNAPGEASADNDGGNAVQLTRSQAYWLDTTAPGQRGRVMLGGD